MWLVWGCSGVERPSLSIDSITPNRVSSSAETTVVIRGAHFDDAVTKLDLSSSDAPRIERKWRVSLEDVPERLNATRVDSTRLRFTVPAGLAARSYAVSVHAPSGVSARLPRALTVTDGPITDYELRIETRADGTGERVGDLELEPGEALSLHAVVRTAAGDFVSGEDEVAWHATGLSDVLSATQGARTVFSSELGGSAVVIAEHASLGEARTGTLRVRAGEPSQNLIAIEDAPSGNGRAIEGPRALSTDDVLTVYAVRRDPAGTFLADVEVTWGVRGEIGSPPPAAARSFTLDLTKPGVGRITAEHAIGSAETGELVVRAGRAASLEIAPNTLTLTADDEPIRFAVSALDADGNGTSNFGNVHWEIESGPITALDAVTGELDPQQTGAGIVRATSSHGPLARTGPIEIKPGRAARLAIAPETLAVSADDSAITFQATAFDADDNPTSNTGTLTYSVASGPIGALDSGTGQLDPKAAGSGTIRVTSSHGPSDDSGTIIIAPGRAAALSVMPEMLATQVGSAPTAFTAAAFDADGNPTLDAGTLSFAVSGGTFGTLDALSGVLSPSMVGLGVVRVTSSYGVAADSGRVVVQPVGPPVEITDVVAPATLSRGQGLARVEVTIANYSPDQTAMLSSVWLGFERSGVSVDADYGVFTDTRNPYRIAPSASATLVFYVSASGSAATGPIEVTVFLEAYVSGYGEVTHDRAAPFTMLSTSAPAAVISRPIPPEDRVCAGNSVPFNGSSSSGIGLSYAWSFEGASVATSNVSVPTGVTFSQYGRNLFALTVTDNTGDRDTDYGSVFVGTSASVATETYPTGRIAFASPAAGGLIDLEDLPADDRLALSSSASLSLRQCNGMPVAASGKRYLTVWSDRGVIDPSQDVQPTLPGIQVALAASGTYFDRVNLLPGAPELEGPAYVYAEYYNPELGVVTAAGHQTFQMDNDTEAPSITASRPSADCSDCIGIGSPWVFQLSEPLSQASLASITVQYKDALNCIPGGFANVTASSTLTYDAASRTLYVRPYIPAAHSGTYTIRLLLNNVRDASSNANQLPFLARCVFVNTQADAAPPAVPSLLSVSADPFSPDGDGVADVTQLAANVDASTRVVRWSLTRGPSDVRTLIQLVDGAGDVTLAWDGRDYTGRVVPDGVYRYELSAENAEGESSPLVVGFIEVDSAPHFIALPFRY